MGAVRLRIAARVPLLIGDDRDNLVIFAVLLCGHPGGEPFCRATT